VFSETWPTSGTTRRGAAYALPTSAPPTPDTGSSCSHGLLKTPTAQLAVNGGSQHPDKRRAGGHGPTLADQIEQQLLPTPKTTDGHHSSPADLLRNEPGLRAISGLLLPTPRAMDGTNGDPNQRGTSGDLMLPSAVVLLPTPTVSDSSGSNPAWGHGKTLKDAAREVHTPAGNPLPPGATTPKPSTDGNASSDGRPRRRRS
jgi:hypothetical protein